MTALLNLLSKKGVFAPLGIEGAEDCNGGHDEGVGNRSDDFRSSLYSPISISMSMTHKHTDIREKHILGPSTTLQVVRADDRDDRPWLFQGPLCKELCGHQIAHCGVMFASKPMEIVRRQQGGTFFLACFEGTGEVLIDGLWREISAGQACLQPPFISNAMRAKTKKPWRFCWVRYEDGKGSTPIASLHSPVLGNFQAVPLRHAIDGLVAESSLDCSAIAMRRWVDLIHGYVAQFARPFRCQDRLQELWQAVQQDLSSDWSLARLAQTAGLSKEHLRRLTTQSLGRTPVQHVTHLRMFHAANLLATTHLGLAEIAAQTAFSNPFSFSNTFLRWTGCRPSEYRRRYQTQDSPGTPLEKP